MVVDLHHCFLHKATVLEKCPQNREGFCLGCKKLMAIHAKIDALNRAVEDLLEEERQLSPTLNDYHDPFTTRLPVEIASSIMYLSLPASPSLQIFHRGFEEKRHIRALVNLGLVSGNWRRISRGEPKLWTILPITIGGGIDPGTSWIREWIERAGGLDLFVRIAMNVPRSSYLERIIPLLIPHTHRWKVLALDMPQPPASLLLSALSSLELCRLDNFMLHIWYHQEPSGIPLGLKASPSTLTIDSDSLDLVTFGWSRLTQITVASIPSLYQCFQIFQDAPSLTHCELAGVSHEGDIWPYDRSINHSSLEFLSPGSCVSEFWNLFTFPSLTTLHLLHITDVLQRPTRLNLNLNLNLNCAVVVD